MGVTAIKTIVNTTHFPVIVRSYENDNPRNRVRVEGIAPNLDPRENHVNANCDIWIPWCNSQEDFEHGKYILVRLIYDYPLPESKFWFWQNGGWIYFTRNDRWYPDRRNISDLLSGDPYVDGERILVIYLDRLHLIDTNYNPFHVANRPVYYDGAAGLHGGPSRDDSPPLPDPIPSGGSDNPFPRDDPFNPNPRSGFGGGRQKIQKNIGKVPPEIKKKGK
jgi:hypothetical protein